MQEPAEQAAKKPNPRGSNTREINADRVLSALQIAYHSGGWTTSKIVALALFHGEDNRLIYAQRLLASAERAGLLLARKLTVRSHALAYVLTRRGASRLAASLRTTTGWTPAVRAGTTWGKHVDGKKWEPPRSWVHSERAIRFLHFAVHDLRPKDKWKALSETQVRRMNPDEIKLFGKCPDGLLVRSGSKGTKAVWVEVEQSRKSGANFEDLLEHLSKLATGHGPLMRIDRDLLDRARAGRQAFLVFPSVDNATSFERAANNWMRRHPGRRLLWQVVIDDGLAFKIGKLVDMGTPPKVTRVA